MRCIMQHLSLRSNAAAHARVCRAPGVLLPLADTHTRHPPPSASASLAASLRDPISDDAKAFVKRMLVVDPKQRATMAELLEDKWLSGPRSESKDAMHTTKELPAANEKLKKLKGTFLAAWAIQHAGDMSISE